MRQICNFVKFKIAPILFSVVLALFLPLHSLTVEAASVALPSNLGVGFDLYSVFRMFNLFGGIDTPSVQELPNYDELAEYGFTEEQYDSLTATQFQLMNEFSPNLGINIKQAISNAVKYKTFRISYELLSLYRAFVASQYGTEIGTDCIFGSVEGEIEPYVADFTYSLPITGTYNNDSFSGSNSINLRSDCICFYSFTRFGSYDRANIVFVFIDPSVTSSSLSDLASVSFSSPEGTYDSFARLSTSSGYYSEYGFSAVHLFSQSYTGLRLNGLTLPKNSYAFTSSDGYVYMSDLAPLVAEYRETGTLSIGSESVSGTLVSDDDILTPTNTIDSDGTIAGDTTFTIPDLSFLNQVLDNLRNGVTDFATAVSSLGLASVSSDATTEDKEAALSSVTSTIASVLTISEAGQTTVDQATNELAESITAVETAEDTFKPYYDPESEDQDYVPNWFFNLPDLSNPEDDNTDDNHLVEIVSALPVVTGLITDLFNASGPLSLLFYIGITFVLFSVLVGMAHFIGSYGDRRALTSSPKALPASPNVPLLTRKKGR